jgi:Flp pilus assembly protein TadB
VASSKVTVAIFRTPSPAGTCRTIRCKGCNVPEHVLGDSRIMAHIGHRRQSHPVCRAAGGQRDVAYGEEMSEPDDDAREAPDAEDDVAPKGLAPSAGVRVLRAIRVPGALLLLGILLTMVGPLPGLGVFLVLGAGLATFVVGMTALVGR